MAAMWDVAGIVLAVGLLLASAAHQLPPVAHSGLVVRADPLRLLPRWSFFAPNPGTRDIHVVLRDVDGEGHGAWRPLDVPTSRRGRWLWHPDRQVQKAVVDAAGALGVLRASLPAQDADLLPLTTPYLRLLTWVMAQPHDGRSTGRQFAVVASHDFGDERPLEVRFVSEVHGFDDRTPTPDRHGRAT